MVDFFNSIASKAHGALKDETTVDLIERGATKAAYAASGVTVVSGLTINEWGVIVGMVGVAITTGFNIWFKMKYQRGKKR
jgi:hypothetical protein